MVKTNATAVSAKFCTFEDMAAHEQECKRLVPSEETK